VELSQDQRNDWLNEAKDLVRGAAGGFLFGIPLLYTMEVWWVGSYAAMPRLLMAIALTFAIVFMLNRTAGFRTTTDVYAVDAATDSLEAIAMGIVCAGFVLILLHEITLETPLPEVLGKLIYESVPFTLGVALSNQFLSGERSQNESTESSHQTSDSETSDSETSDSKTSDSKTLLHATLADIGATLIGSIIIAFNIAPTDEIPMLAATVTGLWLLSVLAASLTISYAIVFAAGFANQSKRDQQQGLFQRPLSETLLAYLLSLVAAMVMLVFFGRLSGGDPWQVWLSYTILLGLPAAVGGAAGRLAI
jgi:putative integral membrane protein (TIGR02587 family)